MLFGYSYLLQYTGGEANIFPFYKNLSHYCHLYKSYKLNEKYSLVHSFYFYKKTTSINFKKNGRKFNYALILIVLYITII